MLTLCSRIWIDCTSPLLQKQAFTGDCLRGRWPFRHIYTPPHPYADWLGSFLADDSVGSCVTVSRSVAVAKHVTTPQVLLPLTAGELSMLSLGACEAQPDTFHRVACLTWLEQARVLLLLLSRAATSPSCRIGSPASLANLPTRLQSKIVLSSHLPTRRSIMCAPSPLLTPLRIWSRWWPALKPLETALCTDLHQY